MRWFCTVPLLILLSAASAGASSITLTTDPANGAIAGAPGSTIGWGFSLTSTYTTEWVSFTGSALTFETNPTVGTYTDFIGLQGGPLPFFAVAPSTTWSQTFDAVMQQGIGSYAIDPGAILSSQNIGSLLLFFDIFDSDPLTGGTQTGSSSLSTPFSVAASASVPEPPNGEVPEPSTIVLLGLGLAGIVARRGASAAVKQ